MPLMVWQLPNKGERLAVLAARIVALGNGDEARTRVLRDGFYAEFAGARFKGAENVRKEYGDMIICDPNAGSHAFSIIWNDADALAAYHVAINSDQAEQDWPGNSAVANVAGILIASILDGSGCGKNAAFEKVAQEFATIGVSSEKARPLRRLSNPKTIRSRWNKRQGIAHLLLGLNLLNANDISEDDFLGFCEKTRLMLSSNGPRNTAAGSVYVPESEQISIVCSGSYERTVR